MTSLLWTSYRRYLRKNLWLLLLPIAILATEDNLLGFDVKMPVAGFHIVVGVLLAARFTFSMAATLAF